MGRRHDLQLKLDSLSEIEGIMTAMKNLAFMETRKLIHFLSAQQLAVASIEAAAWDFTSFHGHDGVREVVETCLLIGSERGFCGDFNEKLLQARALLVPGWHIIAVGRRLESKLETETLIGGATVAEEVAPVLTEIADFLAAMQRGLPAGNVLGITALYHETDGIRTRRLLPLPESKPLARKYAHPPLLNLDPLAFYEKLSEHYLYAALHEALYSSLMVENRYRIDHMDNAISQLDKRMTRLKQRYNTLRQEEIIEEIEIIMLSVETLTGVQQAAEKAYERRQNKPK